MFPVKLNGALVLFVPNVIRNILSPPIIFRMVLVEPSCIVLPSVNVVPMVPKASTFCSGAYMVAAVLSAGRAIVLGELPSLAMMMAHIICTSELVLAVALFSMEKSHLSPVIVHGNVAV